MRTSKMRWPSVAAALLVTGCASVPLAGIGGSGSDSAPICGGLAQVGHWPDYSAGDEALLAPFLACGSPAEFVELQRGVDMPRLVAALSDWSAVRLGAMGPLLAGADLLTRKRAAFLVNAEEKYGAPYAEVLALYVINAAYDDELRALLELLADDKQLQQALGQMCNVKAELARRGLKLSDFLEREAQLSDVGRGLGRAAREALNSSPLSEGGRSMDLTSKVSELPPPCQEAFQKVEQALMEAHFAPGQVAVGCFDSMTFGVPLGIYSLVVGTAEGGASLWKGEYEKATRELAPAALIVALYAGGKGMRALSESEGLGWRGLPLRVEVELRLGAIRELVERLQAQLGDSGVAQLARYLQAQREAAVLVAAGGEPAALALYEAEGNVPRARVFMAKAEAGAGGASLGRAAGGVAALVDEAAGLTAEVLEAKLLETELESPGPRLPAKPALLEQVRPRVDAPPPVVPEGFKLWKDYVAYWERRLAELKTGRKVKGPLQWDGYQGMMGQFARGRAFERAMADRLRADAKLPPRERRWLGDFEQPSIETNVGVAKPGVFDGVRYADVLVIEKAPERPPRVESFSFKSRDFSLVGDDKVVAAQMVEDARAALRFYGETLYIRRPSLMRLGSGVQVRRIRLVYDGGKLMPAEGVLERALDKARSGTKGVEIGVQ